MDKTETPARYLAAKGRVEIQRIREIVERAQRLLDESHFRTDVDMRKLAPPPPFDWERTELFPVGAEANIYQAAFESHTTGEGVQLHFYAGLARSAAEMRRRIAAQLGPTLADQVAIARGGDATVAHSSLFVSPGLSELFRRAEGPDRPAILTYAAHLHLNAT